MMIELILYVIMVLIGVAYIVLEEQIEGDKQKSPVEMIITIHFGFIGLIFVALYYMFTGKYIRS